MTTHGATGRGEGERGSVIVPVLVLLIVLSISVSALLRYSAQEVRSVRDLNAYKRAMVAAEAGLEKGICELRNLIVAHGEPTQGELDAVQPPTLPGYVFETPDASSAFSLLIDGGAHHSETIVEGRWAGLVGDWQGYLLRSGVVEPASRRGVVLAQSFQKLVIPLFQFAIFYEQDLEILPGRDMTISGPVHTNDGMWVGAESGSSLSFDDRVTVRSDILHGRKDSASEMTGGVTFRNKANTAVSMYVDGEGWVDHRLAGWGVRALQLWGERVSDSAHNVPRLNLPIPHENVPHEIIERAVTGGDPALEENKFENKANLIIWRDSTGTIRAKTGDGAAFPLTYTVYVGGTPTTRTIATSASFADWREGNGTAKTMHSLDINIANLKAHPGYPQTGVCVYTYNNYRPSGTAAVCRLKSGSELPAGGLTVASPNPVYIQGSYNATGTTRPALVCGDAVTILSNAWTDSNSTKTLTYRKASNTIVNTVIMTGNTATVVGQYNGGLENVLRFQEDWSGITLRYRGSLICLWLSTIASGPWVYGNNRYTAPIRDWGYDTMYRDVRNAPPAVPQVYALEALTWHQDSWGEDERL